MPTVDPAAAQRLREFETPFTPTTRETESVAAIPSAEEVWARVHSAALTRAGLLAGLAAVVVVGAAALLHTQVNLAALIFALVCAAVLALRGRLARSLSEHAALGVPATALVMIACVQVQTGAGPLRLIGVCVLVVVATLAVWGGLAVAGGRLPGWVSTVAAYLEYATVAAVIPVALWALW